MIERIALKRLTSSDLTFFESLFRTLGAGNQKAINLNADVFVDRLYPGLPGLVSVLGDVIPVTMTVFGPDSAPPYVMSRAVTKRDAYKNWRLNGEFVRDPEGEVGRFDILRAGDLALIEFQGEPGPQRVILQLIAEGSATDAPLHGVLNPIVPAPPSRRTMVQITRSQIAAAAVPPEHPIWQMAADPELDAALEDAAMSGTRGAETLRKRPGRTITVAALAAAKLAAEQSGRDGEALAWVHLQKMKDEGSCTSIEWTSKENAVSPFDFQLLDSSGITVRIDAKSTAGDFARVIHMSVAELMTAADGQRYDLWRIYEITDEGARLRVSRNIGAFSKSILDALVLPAGVTVDSVSIDPAQLEWSSEIAIVRPDDAT